MGVVTGWVRSVQPIVALAALATLAAGVPAAAQHYPNKPIRLVVPFAADGTTDVLARPVAEQLGASVQQSVIVENRTGGNSLVEGQGVAGAAPDGTPGDAINLLNRELTVITRNAQFRERVRNAGAEVNAGSPEDFNRTIKTEIDFWSKVAAAVNFRPE